MEQQQQQPSGTTAPAPVIRATDADASAKRQALTGQWRTPPLPVFAASSKDQLQQHHAPPVQQHVPQQQHAPPQQQHASQPEVTFVPTALPDSSEDYAKALQEAYRRGAEAAAAMTMGGAAAPTGTSVPVMPGAPPAVAQMPTAVSCPNLADLRPSRNVMFADEQHPQVPNVEVVGEAVPNPLQPPPPQPHQPMQPPPPATTTVHHHHHHTMQHLSAGQPVATTSAASRSLSLPDMASFAARAQAEEEKRKKRLARNRASARLRRLRKKNLVDSYEGEVGVLESSLQKLKAHEWGNSQDHEALLEALSMERGQQVISSEERSILIKEILEQQRTQVAWIKECQLEQLTLKWLSECNGKETAQEQRDEEEVQLCKELQDLLQLTEEQMSNIRCSTEGLEQEVTAVETVDDCLKAMQEKDWLLNEGVTSISNQFTSILHPNQISKFLLWTDANAEAIEQLDYCHAPRAISPPGSSPVFGFGMDGDYHSNTQEDDDK